MRIDRFLRPNISRKNLFRQAALRSDLVSFNSLLNALSRSAQWRWRSLPQCQLNPDAVSFNGTFRWRIAWELLRHMGQVTTVPNTITYGTLLKATNSWQGALFLCRSASCRPVPMDRVNFDSAIRTCDQWARAFMAASEMQRQKVVASKVTYNALLQVSKNFWARSLTLLQAMVWRRMAPDAVSYSLCCDWRSAYALLQECPECGALQAIPE
ncbi:unnamed protein product [Effrenium voratum]|nr:unnamed protein product [Effrenium voratum]